MLFRYFLIFLILFSKNLYAQQNFNKLKKEVAIEKNGGKRAVFLSKFAEINRFYNPKESVTQILTAISLAKNEGTNEQLAQVYLNSVKVFKKADSLLLMIKYADEALIIANQSDNDLLKGNAHQLKGFAELNLNNEQKAVEHFYKSLFFLDKTNATAEQAKTFYYLFEVFAERGDLDKERIYAEKCLEYSQKSNNADMLCTANQAMGTHNYDLYQSLKQNKYFDKAIEYFKTAERIFSERRNEIITQNQYGIICLNIADIYIANYKTSYKSSIIKYSNLALNSAERLSDFSIMSNVYLIQSNLAEKDGDKALQEKLLITAENKWKKLKIRDNYVLGSLFLSLSTFYEREHKSNDALVYYKKYIDSYQNLNSTKKKSDLHLLEAKFQSEKKEEQLRLLTQKNQLQLRLNYFSFATAILLIVGLMLLNRSFRYKLKFQKQKSLVLETQKDEAELLAKLKAEEKSRIEAENKLIDAQKIQLQKELVANALQVEHKNDLLKSLNKKFEIENFSDKAQFKLQSILRAEIRLDNDINIFKTELQDINPLFIQKLKDSSVQKLSNLDVKYCAAIYAQLSTKQIAMLFNVEPESVRMSKYRIKQKIGLAKEDDLEAFLMNF